MEILCGGAIRTCFVVGTKADYWPQRPADPILWNPRRERRDAHLLALADGRLYPVTPTGAFTLRRLRLNRAPLVAHRSRRLAGAEEQRLLSRYRDVIGLLEQLQQQQAAFLEEQRTLLEEQRRLLKLLMRARD